MDDMTTASAAPVPTPGGGQAAKESAEQAGYMELSGAQKDADCQKVEVEGGVSSNLGCCNDFEPKDETVQQFKCGNCQYVEGGGQGPAVDKQEAIGSDHPLNQLRAKPSRFEQ